MTISILIPAHNEEKSIARCVESCLHQTRPPDEIVVVNDGSEDRTSEILASFGEKIKVITIQKATGNKSFAQEVGLQYVSGEVFVSTDADTILDERFVELVEKDFQNLEVVAVAGYVKSLKYNWLTACRALEYFIGQNLYKVGQNRLNFLFVIPGAAGAFRTEIFKKHIGFDHDTLTEDLDFTYKLHSQNLKIAYNRQAIVWTQDPADFHSYINQMRRWYGGGWQSLLKHLKTVRRPAQVLELSLMYIEALVFSMLFILMPLFSVYSAFYFIGSYFLVLMLFAVLGAAKEKRPDFLIFFPLYPILCFINAWIFLEQFSREVILRKKNLIWFQPKRIANSV